VFLPGTGVQGRRLHAKESWTVTNGVTSGQWVSFADPETTQILAAALLPDNSTIAQLLFFVGVSGILRMNPVEPLIAANGLTTAVVARLWTAGAASAQTRPLAPRGHVGDRTSFTYNANGQWLEFFDSDGPFITGTGAGSFSEVMLQSPKQIFEIGTPFPVGPTALTQVPEGASLVPDRRRKGPKRRSRRSKVRGL
jgi:hypothetical protein